MCSIIFVPIILIIFAVTILFSGVRTSYVSYSFDSASSYDENTLQDYADTQYAAEFGSSSAYEDNILLVFLTEDDEYYDYCYIAWVGDHIVTDINYLFGNESTELGQAISESVNVNSYKYSLDSNLAQVIATMEKQIASAGLASSFTCDENHIQVRSHLTNKSDIALTEDTVNSALEQFTKTTGIPIVIVVDDLEDVFGKEIFGKEASALSGGTIVIAVALIALAVWLIVRSVRKKKKNDDNENRTYTGPEID